MVKRLNPTEDIDEIVRTIDSKYVLPEDNLEDNFLGCGGFYSEAVSARLSNIDFQRFNSKQGALFYLRGDIEDIVAISFNQPVWAYKSVQEHSLEQEHYGENPNHILKLMTHDEAKLQPDIFSTSAYTGGVVGILHSNSINPKDKKVKRCDFKISPFEFLFGVREASRKVNHEDHLANRRHYQEYEKFMLGKRKTKPKKKVSRSIGYGSDIEWFINVPSEIISDYRILGSVNQLRDSFFSLK